MVLYCVGDLQTTVVVQAQPATTVVTNFKVSYTPLFCHFYGCMIKCLKSVLLLGIMYNTAMLLMLAHCVPFTVWSKSYGVQLSHL